jgi:hypothetical protein
MKVGKPVLDVSDSYQAASPRRTQRVRAAAIPRATKVEKGRCGDGPLCGFEAQAGSSSRPYAVPASPEGIAQGGTACELGRTLLTEAPPQESRADAAPQPMLMGRLPARRGGRGTRRFPRCRRRLVGNMIPPRTGVEGERCSRQLSRRRRRSQRRLRYRRSLPDTIGFGPTFRLDGQRLRATV